MKDTLAEKAYSQILELILDGVYTEGDTLSERELSLRLDISRTPIREALKRLGEGDLVEHIKNRGAIVSSISIKKLLEQFEIREIFEEYAIKKIFDEQLALDLDFLEQNIKQTEDALNRGDFKEYYLKEREFHFEILRAIGNQEMLDQMTKIKDMHSMVMLYKKIRKRNSESAETIKEHKEILKCLRLLEKEGALEAIKKHNSKAKNRVKML